MADTLQIEIVTPERLLVSDQATEVQVPGMYGYLGILPGHAPLITELKSGELSYRRSDGKIERLSVVGDRLSASQLPEWISRLAIFNYSVPCRWSRKEDQSSSTLGLAEHRRPIADSPRVTTFPHAVGSISQR